MSLWGLLTGLGHGLVSWGLGGSDDGDEPPTPTGAPGTIAFVGRASPVNRIIISGAAAPACTIALVGTMSRLNPGDIARLPTIEIRDEDGALADPTTLTIRVRTPLGSTIELVYGTAPTSGPDSVTRTSAGVYVARVRITEERGVGVYGYSVIATGDVEAAESGNFTVYALAA
ncbi:hypothetical protein [Sorangium sp. So ce1024]|uniref:hypothetical protein n=1 Tax=Sorangium sp. So ce1024 TaxID=3133327 RepID=UPI003F0CEC90